MALPELADQKVVLQQFQCEGEATLLVQAGEPLPLTSEVVHVVAAVLAKEGVQAQPMSLQTQVRAELSFDEAK